MKIGKAKFGGQTSRKYFKLKDGEQVYRILPPLGELADQGRWSVFHSVHYGYKSTDGKQKPFLSCEAKDRKTGTIQVGDAAKDRITKLKAQLEEGKKAGNKVAIDALEPLVGNQGMYNLDSNHYMNVVDSQGHIGILKIRHKAKLALEAEIRSLNADGVDPLSVEDGRYFVFSRTGMGRDTTFGVKVLKEKLKVDGVGVVERDVVHVLDEDLQARLSAEAGELGKIFKTLTSEEVKQVVDGSDLKTGVSPALDKLFGSKAQAVAEEDNAESDIEAIGTAADIATAQAPVQATYKSAPAKAATKVVAPKTQATSIAEMDPETFLAQLEAGTLS